jgi:5-methylcytosine-specific restriction endonuclease McrA
MSLQTACLSCGALFDGAGRSKSRGRCESCARFDERTRRPSAKARGYDAAYRRRRASLIGRPCELRLPDCTVVATTADHVIPVSRGGRHGPLRPACAHCNSAAGAAVARGAGR